MYLHHYTNIFTQDAHEKGLSLYMEPGFEFWKQVITGDSDTLYIKWWPIQFTMWKLFNSGPKSENSIDGCLFNCKMTLVAIFWARETSRQWNKNDGLSYIAQEP